MKKLLSIILATVVLLTVSAVPAFAAMVTETTGAIVASGIPTAENLTYTNGNYEMSVETSNNVTASNDAAGLKIVNNTNDAGNITVKIKYPSDVKSGKYTFGLNFTTADTSKSSDYTFGAFKISAVQKDGTTKFISDVPVIVSGKWLNASETKTKYNQNLFLRFDIDMLSGDYKTRRVEGDTGGTLNGEGLNGTADVSNGIDCIEVYMKFPGIAGDGVIITGASVKEHIRYTITDKITYINGMTELKGSYNGVNVATSIDKDTASCTIEKVNDTIVMSGVEGESVKMFYTIAKPTPITPTANAMDKLTFMEITCSADKPLTSASRLYFRPTVDGKNPGGGSLSPATYFTEANVQHKVAILLDVDTNRYALYVDGNMISNRTMDMTASSQISKVHLEFYDTTAAKLTIHNIKYMEIEPYNYDVATDSYISTDELLMDQIPMNQSDFTWSYNNKVSFVTDLSGTATAKALPYNEGIEFTGTNIVNPDGEGDYARLELRPAGVVSETFPSGYLYASWDMELKGNEEQRVSITGKGSAGKWTINHALSLNPGAHKIEFLYNPQTDAYAYYVDGVRTSNKLHSDTGLALINIEYKGVATTDTLTLKNVTFKNLQDNGIDTAGEVVMAPDGMSATAIVNIGKEFGTLSGEVYFIIAAYDESGNKLTSVNVEKPVLKKGVNELSTAIDSLEGGVQTKAYLWREMEPIEGVID